MLVIALGQYTLTSGFITLPEGADVTTWEVGGRHISGLPPLGDSNLVPIVSNHLSAFETLLKMVENDETPVDLSIVYGRAVDGTTLSLDHLGQYWIDEFNIDHDNWHMSQAILTRWTIRFKKVASKTITRVIATAPPNKLLNTALSARSGLVATLSWAAPATDQGVSSIEWSYTAVNSSGNALTPLDWTTLTSPPATSKEVTLPSLDYVYTIYLRAVNSAGAGPASDPIVVSASAPLPTVPTNLAATVDGLYVTLSWDDPSNSLITAYQYSTDGSTWVTAAGASTNQRSYDFIGTPDTDYTLYLRAVTSGGGGPSSSVTASTPAKPATPVLTGSVSGDQVTLAWGAIAGATAYEVNYDGAWRSFVDGNQTSGVLHLVPQTTYNIKIRALAGRANYSDSSNTISVTTGN